MSKIIHYVLACVHREQNIIGHLPAGGLIRLTDGAYEQTKRIRTFDVNIPQAELTLRLSILPVCTIGHQRFTRIRFHIIM